MSIHIKKSHRGLLHKNLGVAQGEKIPASKLKVKSTDSPAVKKRKIFAQNAKKWHHADGGLIEYDEGGKVYNPKLASSDLNFQSWYKGNTLEGKKGIPYSDKLDYDYYSYYKDALSTGGNPTEHFTDAYKKPNHPTFSNESYYAGNGAKGYWKGNKFVKYADGGITSQTQPVGGKVGSLIGVGTALAQPVINAAIPNDVYKDTEGNVVGSAEGAGKSALSEAAKYASMGAMLGPWGALAGGAIGAGIGLWNADKNEKEMKQLQKDANNRIITKNRIGGPNRSIGLVQTNTDNLYPYGGEITNDQMNPNAELEKEEQFRTPQGITGGVDGPEHSEGGIEVNLPEGTQVFSDRLKLDGKTYAKRAKSLNNKIAKLEKKPETQATKNSIMLLDQQLDDLFNTQEAMKEEKMAKKMFAKGGIIPAHNVRIMKVGGLTHYDGEEGPSVVINDPNKQLKYGFEDQTSKFAPAQPVQTVVDNYGVSRPTVSGATNPVLSSSTSPSQDNSSFLSPSNMALIGSIGNNIVQNQMINSVKRPRTISNVYFGAGPRPTRVDMSGERSAIDAEAAGAKRGLFLGSNSYSTQASNLQSIRNNQLAAKGRSFQNQANANTTIDNAYNDKVTEAYNKSLATNLGIDQYNMENQYNFDLWKTGNKLKNMGASNDLITNVFNNQTNKENQLAYWNVMKNMFEKKVGKDIGMPEKKYGGKIRTLKYKK